MFWLLRNLRRDFRAWDRTTRIAVSLGLLLLLCAIIVLIVGPSEIRTYALFGAGALVLIVQIAVMYGNRGMTTVYSQAQRMYLRGDFESASQFLESARLQGRADVRLLTLLGNTYRQLGELEKSAAVLSEALDKAPDNHFPLYGFGRTLLSQGHYAESVTLIRRAIDSGAPPVVLVDLGEAYFRMGSASEARSALLAAAEQRGTEEASHRELMVRYLLFELGEGFPPTPELIQAGLPYWQASAKRFAHTPYGTALQDDVRALESAI